MEAPPQGYRRNVGICLINSSKKIFAASRLDIPDAWQMPQGGVDEGEDPRSTAIRELREETRVPYWMTYDFPPHVGEKLRHQWGFDWKGQAQKWFLLKSRGSEEEINLLGDGTEKAEFGEWSWMSPEQVVERLSEVDRPTYDLKRGMLEHSRDYLMNQLHICERNSYARNIHRIWPEKGERMN